MTRRRIAQLAALTVSVAASGLVLTATPASACQPESCPSNSPVCQALRNAPPQLQCRPIY